MTVFSSLEIEDDPKLTGRVKDPRDSHARGPTEKELNLSEREQGGRPGGFLALTDGRDLWKRGFLTWPF